MSLINQVLNRLEQRGAHTAPDQTLVRAVPPQAERRRVKLVALVTALSAVLVTAAWLLTTTKQKTAEQKSAEQTPVQRLAAVGELQSPVAAVPAPVEDVILQPASKKSFELSAVPLHETLRESRTAKPPVSAEDHPAVAAQTPKPAPMANKPATLKPAATRDSGANALPLKQISRTQQADTEYRKAAVLQQQGRDSEALAGYDAALKLNAQHEGARLAQAVLLVENKRSADAEHLLQEGLQLKPAHSGFSMVLARVQVERGNLDQALETLQRNLPQADDKADYQAFYAALLQREGRHEEAVSHYQIAVQLAPNNGIWLMGYGISLQAMQRIEEARTAYRQALTTRTLSPELTAFVQQKLQDF